MFLRAGKRIFAGKAVLKIILYRKGLTQGHITLIPTSQRDGLWLARKDLATHYSRLNTVGFFRGLAPGSAPGRLDGFSIGRYEKNCESFDLYAAKFESGAMRF